ncbi:MAG: glutamine amidotransferase [Rhodospirillales bacterium]|jgi:methylamine---glutamate N-methyltransferase subunit A|nr:glutamine amidotransferase [Rhodospirillales bacterium]
MCGIAGLIHRGKTSNIGSEMTDMLQALKHRGPDSTGFAIYGKPPSAENEFVMRFKVAESEDLAKGSNISETIIKRRKKVNKRMKERGATIISEDDATEYAYRYTFTFDGNDADLEGMTRYIEELEGAEILSMGRGLELIKDLGDAGVVANQYGLQGFQGTHALGHTRMATESDVDIRSAHPYWAFPYNDISVVHNGQITNYWIMRRQMEYKGHRFMSNCDSELLAVYTADKLNDGYTLEDSLRQSIEEIDGVFTYCVATKDSLGMAKDTMAAKPMVLYETDDLVILASEEGAIRAMIPHEIDTYDPYDEEVRVWQA